MKKISLTQGQFALVDDEDYDHLMQWKWHAQYSYCTKSFYANRGQVINGKNVVVSMHRQLLSANQGDVVDHENHNTLDNQRLNISIKTSQENAKNRRLYALSKSGFTGVNFHIRSNKWIARLKLFGKEVHLGCFANKEDAIEARKLANIEYGFHLNHGCK